VNKFAEMLQEFNQEASTTKRVLDRVPPDKLGWKPHERSMSLGQLALHIATVPGGIVQITRTDTFDASQNNFNLPEPADKEAIYTAFEKSTCDVTRMLNETTDAVAQEPWRLMFGEKELMRIPRANVWRSIMLNHWYHHRGELAVYLRLLDVPVPSIYGPSADENPFL
jgi:uncharacterized damage-inducible protein DinB